MAYFQLTGQEQSLLNAGASSSPSLVAPPASQAKKPSDFMTGGQVVAGGMVSNVFSAFQRAYNWIVSAEGSGYENVPGDPGGPTNTGILQGEYNAWLRSQGRPSQDIRNLTEGEAKAIYFSKYWRTSPAPGVPAPSSVADPRLQLVLFDTAVNPVSGVWGDVRRILSSGVDDAAKAQGILTAREERYRGRVAAAPSMGKFLQGWLNRIERLRKITLGGGPGGSDPGFWDTASEAVLGARGDGTGGIVGSVQSAINSTISELRPSFNRFGVNTAAVLIGAVLVYSFLNSEG